MIKPIKIKYAEAVCLAPGRRKLAELMQKRLHECYDCNNPTCKCKKQAAFGYVHSFTGQD